MGPTQELQQKVCQKYGWSIEFGSSSSSSSSSNNNDDDDVDGYCIYHVTVITGFDGPPKRFAASHPTDKMKIIKDEKAAKSAVSALALEGLAAEIQREEAKPVRELVHVFSAEERDLDIQDSQLASTWDRFWAHPRPSVVGIDIEGNQISPPVLVQIATNDYVILEVPQKSKGGLSQNIQRLLQDDSITKVFCDNFSNKDKKSLGMALLTLPEKDDFTTPPIVDLEFMAMELLGPVKVARGLGKLTTMCMPELGVRIEKPKNPKGGKIYGRLSRIGRFALIEQGKAKPLRGLFDLSKEEQHYAALDAWITLQIYHRLQEKKGKASSSAEAGTDNKALLDLQNNVAWPQPGGS
jgi:hypothetical protein